MKPGASTPYLPDCYDPYSASTGTAWATGQKTIDERISQGPSSAGCGAIVTTPSIRAPSARIWDAGALGGGSRDREREPIEDSSAGLARPPRRRRSGRGTLHRCHGHRRNGWRQQRDPERRERAALLLGLLVGLRHPRAARCTPPRAGDGAAAGVGALPLLGRRGAGSGLDRLLATGLAVHCVDGAGAWAAALHRLVAGADRRWH